MSTILSFGSPGSVGPPGPPGGEAQFFADQLLNPTTSEWPTTNVAPLSVDTINNSLLVRRFDDTVEEGVGASFFLRSGVSTLTFRFVARAESAPGGGVPLNFYFAQVLSSFSGFPASPDFTLNLNLTQNWASSQIGLSVPGLGLIPGLATQACLTRSPGTLAGDLTLFGIGFTQS